MANISRQKINKTNGHFTCFCCNNTFAEDTEYNTMIVFEGDNDVVLRIHEDVCWESFFLGTARFGLYLNNDEGRKKFKVMQ